MKVCILWILAAGCLVVAACNQGENIVGSGKRITKQISIADFTSIDVAVPIALEFTQSEKLQVSIAADDNLIEHFQFIKEGELLKVRFEAAKSWTTKQAPTVTIQVPALEGLGLSATSRGTIKGLKSSKGFRAKITGASTLSGSVQAASFAVEAAGASKVTLTGDAKSGTLSAAGASELNLGQFTLDQANVTLSGASQATIEAKGKLDYALSGASRLTYEGDPTIGKAATAGASSVSRR